MSFSQNTQTTQNLIHSNLRLSESLRLRVEQKPAAIDGRSQHETAQSGQHYLLITPFFTISSITVLLKSLAREAAEPGSKDFVWAE